MPYTPKIAKNNASGILITDSTSTITVDVTGYTLPTSISSGQFKVSIVSEILLVTGVTDNTTYYTLDVTRAQESTVQASHSAGNTVDLQMTAGLYNEVATQVSTNTTKLDLIDVTGASAINLNTLYSDTTTNNAKISFNSTASTKLGHISVTQAVDLDTLESDTTTNNAKVTNANHTGDVTGSAGLVIVPSAISGKTGVTAVSGDYVLLWDATDSALKKANVSDFIGGGAVDSVNGFTGVVSLVTADISDTTSTQKYATAAEKTKLGYISVTQAVDLDTMESNISTNNSKVTNADHTGDVTGSAGLVIVPSAISGKTGVTPVAGDYLLLWDATDSLLKKVDATNFLGGAITSVNGYTGVVSLVTADISDTTSTQKYATAAEKTKLGYISVTQAVDLDTMESNISTNNSKVTNADHTGDVTGSAGLVIVPSAISGKTGVTAVSGDYVLIWDATDSLLKKANVSDFIGGGAVDSVNGFTGVVTLVTANISDTTSTQKYTTAADITKMGYISVTQAVNLDTIESDTTTNNAKVTNANHTGDVTGSAGLVIVPSAISGKTGVTPVAGDYLLLWDATDSALKKVDASAFLDGGVTSVNGSSGAVTLVTGNISDTTSTQKYTTAANLTKIGYISVTQAVDLDTMESNIATNNAKVTNANHTGDVTGSAGLVIVPAAISGKTGVTPVAGDYVLLWDATDSLLKKADVTSFINGSYGDVTGPGSATNTGIAIFNGTGGKTLMSSLVTIDTSSVTIPGALTVTAQARYSTQTTLASSGSITWNINNEPKGKIALTGNVSTLTISGININSEATLYVTQNAASAYTITWPGTVLWAGGTAPDLSALSSKHIISFYSHDGTNLFAAHVSDATGTMVTSVNGSSGAVTLVTGNISDTTSTQKYATAAEKTKLGYISVTQAVDLDTMESNISTNNAKVTNADHTGDVTGSAGLVIVPSAISGKTGVTPVAGDYVLLWDATDSLLKKADVSTFISAAGDVTGPGSSTNTGIAIFNGTDGKLLSSSLVTVDTSSVTIPGFLTITGQARHSTQTALSTSAIVTWNINNNPKANIILTNDVTSFTISGININSEAALYLKQDATVAKTITWPGTIIWAGGSQPNLSVLNSKHVISFYSYDGTGLIGSHISDDSVSIVSSVNGSSGAVTLVTGNISDTTSTQKYTTAANLTKIGYISVTQAVDLDTMESNISTNNAKVTNADHTGDVTGSAGLVIVPAAISGKTGVTPVAGDYLLLWDATDSLLKKVDATNFLGGAITSVNGYTGVVSLVTADISDTTSTQKYATAAEKTKLGYISVTQAVDLDTIESDTTTNNAKVTNATHTGEVTGSGALTIDPTAISGKTGVTPVAGDYLLLWDATDSALKKVDATNFLGGAVASVNGYTGVVALVTADISDTTSTQKYTTAANLTKIGYISVTGAINLDTILSDTTTNNAKVTNATHTGDVTGAAALTIVPSAISGKTLVTAVAGDHVLLWDATDSLIKKADVTDFISSITASSTTTFTNKRITKRVTTLTDAATIAINCDNMDMGRCVLTASRTLGTPTGSPSDGQPLLLEIVQGGSGSYTLTAESVATAGSYRFGSDVTGFVLSTAVGKKDLILLTYLSDITGWAIVSMSKGYPA
jgi:proteasome assembly chaperone (PAC2) family protein